MSLIRGMVPGRILEALARYRFLTIPQLVELGAGADKGVRTGLQGLLSAKLIDRQEFRLGPSAGRLHNVHWLTTKGARFLADANDEPPIEAPRAREIKPAHAWHRRLTVDAMIAADRWATAMGRELPQIRSYMEWRGPSSVTGISLPGKNAIADLILDTTDTAGNRRMYVLEVYCSNYSEGQSTFSRKQLEPYVMGGMTDALDDALEIGKTEKAARVLVVCDSFKLRDRLLRRLPERPGMPPLAHQVWNRFHFKAADELRDFGADWHTIHGNTVSLPI